MDIGYDGCCRDRRPPRSSSPQGSAPVPSCKHFRRQKEGRRVATARMEDPPHMHLQGLQGLPSIRILVYNSTVYYLRRPFTRMQLGDLWISLDPAISNFSPPLHPSELSSPTSRHLQHHNSLEKSMKKPCPSSLKQSLGPPLVAVVRLFTPGARKRSSHVLGASLVSSD